MIVWKNDRNPFSDHSLFVKGNEMSNMFYFDFRRPTIAIYLVMFNDIVILSKLYIYYNLQA